MPQYFNYFQIEHNLKISKKKKKNTKEVTNTHCDYKRDKIGYSSSPEEDL